MPETDRSQLTDGLQVVIEDDVAYVRILGRGSFKISHSMKKFGAHAMKRGVKQFIFDMSPCVSMDSTFMGVLAGLSFRLRNQGGGEMIMINLTSRTRGLLATLGLDQLIEPYMEGHLPESLKERFGEHDDLAALELASMSRQETARMMLEAHEALVEVHADNLPKFQDVLSYLKEDVESEEDKGAGEG
jgi:anti-anti-sigma regulatory factor